MTETPEPPLAVQDEILTHREAAAFLKVHPDTLTRWVSEGVVPKPGKVGGRLRYLRSTLLDLARPRCPEHGIPDCSPLLNGCSRLTTAHPDGISSRSDATRSEAG